MNLAGIEFPVKVKDIGKFEQLNPEISVNVLAVNENGVVYPLRATKEKGRKHQVWLLLLTDGDKSHYTLVSNVSRILSKQITTDHGVRHFCPNCLFSSTNQSIVDKHTEECTALHKPVRIKFPSSKIKTDGAAEGENQGVEDLLGFDDAEEKKKLEREIARAERKLPDNVMYFKNYEKTFKVGFVMYADFECFIREDGQHIPSGFCVYTVSSHPDYVSKPYIYSGPGDVMEHFFDYIYREYYDVIEPLLKQNQPMLPLTAEQSIKHDAATKCQCCNFNFTQRNCKTAHHCHVTGQYLGPVCNNCNLQLKPRKMSTAKDKVEFFLPVVFHGLRNYDGHLIVKYMSKKFTRAEIKVVAENTERFLFFQVAAFRFLDSVQFLNGSLDILVSNLRDEGIDRFVHTARNFKREDMDLVTSKGVYPYEYMDSEEKFAETALPPKEKFFSALNDSHISDDDYARAQKVWAHFKMNSLKEYHDLYLMTDVILLADVFETFRKLSLDIYGLDPAQYYTLPGKFYIFYTHFRLINICIEQFNLVSIL